jgi:anaerobic selenocysteine-containing dehydrogenase
MNFDSSHPAGEPASIVKTVCHRDCPDTCFVDAVVKAGRIISTRGSRENPITQGFLCPRGIGDPRRVYSAERVLHPFVRDGSEFRRVSWPEALDAVADKLAGVLENSGSESVLHYDYPGNQGFLAWQYPERLWHSLGATVTDGALCATSGHAGIGLHYGLTYGLGFEQVLTCGAIVFWGNNARVSSQHLWALSIRARKENRTALVSIDPRKSETSKGSDLWINPRPGSDVALFYGMARYLIERNEVSGNFIEEWTTGYDELKKEAANWTRERVEKTTGLPWPKVEELCRVLVKNPPAAFMIGLGLNKSGHGAEAARAVSLLPALLGQHRGFHYSDSKGRTADWGYINGSTLSGKKSKVVEQVSLGPRLKAGEFRFVFVNGSNPASTLPDQAAVRAGLSRDDVFVVVHETHWTETARLASIVLPSPTYLEKTDLNFSDHHLYARLSQKAVEPLGESRDEIWVMHQIANRLKASESWLFEDPWHALRVAMAGAFENGGVDDLLKGAILKLCQKPRQEYQTPSRKIEFYSSTSHERGATPLPRQLAVEADAGWFILLNSALPKWTHSQFRDVYGRIPEIVWISPADAAGLGIEEGDEVVLFNEQGALTLAAVVTGGISQGVLWSPRPVTGRNGVPLNVLGSGKPQSMGSGPRFNSIRVRIRTASSFRSAPFPPHKG